MSWQDRPYSDDDGGSHGTFSRPGELRIGFRRPTMLVTWLVLINVAVHLLHLIVSNASPGGFGRLFGLSFSGIVHLKVWQIVTYMFVHDTVDLLHIVFNMLLLYFVGAEIERGFGRERFLWFYFICGVIGGLAYLGLGALAAAGKISAAYYDLPLVGASGAVWGLLMAAMIFYPQMQIIFIIFPMPIRVFGAIMLGLVLLQAISPGGVRNLGGEVCHFGGAMAGVGVLYYWGVMPNVRFGSGRGPGIVSRLKKGAWARRQRKLAAEQVEVDRILEKVHQEGINSLSRRERKMLAEATQRQRERDRQTGRIDRV